MKRNIIIGFVAALMISACTTTPVQPETYYQCYDQSRWSDAGHQYIVTITKFIGHDGAVTYDASGFYVKYRTSGDSFTIHMDRARVESSYAADQSLTADLKYTTRGLPADSHIEIEFPSGALFRSGPSLERYGYSPNLTANWPAFETEIHKYNSAQISTRNPEEKVVDQRALSLLPLRTAADKYLEMNNDMNRRILSFTTSCTLETVDDVILT